MNKFKTILKKEEATNILINQIRNASKEFNKIDIETLYVIEKNTKKILASFDDLNRSFLEIEDMRQFLLSNTKIERVYTTSSLKENLMLNILKNTESTNKLICDINLLNNELKEEAISDLIKIKTNIDYIIESIESLVGQVKNEIEEKTFNPLSCVEGLLKEYLNYDEKCKLTTPYTKTETIKTIEKKPTVEDKYANIHNEDTRELLMAIDNIIEICKKKQYNINCYNLNSVKEEVINNVHDVNEHIIYISLIYNNLLSDGYLNEEELNKIEKHIKKAVTINSRRAITNILKKQEGQVNRLTFA